MPESEFLENELSLLETVQESAPVESQKILARDPEETDGGTAQMSALSGPKYCGGGGCAGAEEALDDFGFVGVAAAAEIVGAAIENPRATQRLSK